MKAKDSFIGDNNVPTNAAGSGVSVDGVLVAPFASPTVNVRRLKLKSQDVDKPFFMVIRSGRPASQMKPAWKP